MYLLSYGKQWITQVRFKDMNEQKQSDYMRFARFIFPEEMHTWVIEESDSPAR